MGETDRNTYEMKHLEGHAYKGDRDMEGWKIHWDKLHKNQESPLTSKQSERIFRRHAGNSPALKDYVSKYDMCLEGDQKKSYEYLSSMMDKVVVEKRRRLNKEACAASSAWSKTAMPVHEIPETSDPGPAGGDKGGDKGDKGGKKRGKGGKDGKGKDQGPAHGTDAKKGAGKGKTDSEGRELRCVHHWFAQCRSHPLAPGATCRFGPHVTHPRDDEKLRPEFLKMEAKHGKWESGKFKYEATPAATPAADAAGTAVEGDVSTPAPSPRNRRF